MDWGTFKAITSPELLRDTQWESIAEDHSMQPDARQFQRLDEDVEVDWGVLDNLDLEMPVGNERAGGEGAHRLICP